MIKRAIITKDKFRISMPGVDVDAAADHEFIVHEAHLAAQPYWADWIPCPFAGAGPGNFSETVNVTVPGEIASPSILLIPRGTTGNNYYPSPISFSGSFPTQWADAWSYGVTGSPPLLTVSFSKTGQSSAPLGAWLVLIKRE